MNAIDAPRAVPGGLQTLGLACSVLFLLPFAVTGLVAMGVAIAAAVRGDAAEAAFAGVFALTFGGVGFGSIFAVKAARRRMVEVARDRALHRDEPWMLRPDWAAGRLEHSSRKTSVQAAIFATLWNVIALPAAVFATRGLLAGDGAQLAIVYVFPLIGVGLAIWAIREGIRAARFGVSVFELAHVPGVVGRGVGGVLRTSADVWPSNGFHARLQCINRVVTGSGKNRSVRETVKWQDEVTVRDVERDPDGEGVITPVVFRLPADADPTDDSNPRDSVRWRLDITADVPGVDFLVEFELPVFRTADSVFPEPAPDRADPLKPFEQSRESKIRVMDRRGVTEIEFPAARDPMVAAGTTAFAALFAVVVWILFATDAPLLLPLLFGFAVLALTWASVTLWMRMSVVSVERGIVEVRTGLLAPTRTHRFDTDDIEGIEARRGMQSGKRQFYDILIRPRTGRAVKAGSHVPTEREARWLVRIIKDKASGKG